MCLSGAAHILPLAMSTRALTLAMKKALNGKLSLPAGGLTNKILSSKENRPLKALFTSKRQH